MNCLKEFDEDNYYNWSGEVGAPGLNNNNTMYKGHNLKMIGGFALMFVIGGLQALHAVGNWAVWIDIIVPLLLTIEHAWNGNFGSDS